MTIVGFERRSNGSCNLLVLDPMFRISSAVRQSIGKPIKTSTPEKLLKAYRKGDNYLGKYKSFEILR